jgi:hypothetical protein
MKVHDESVQSPEAKPASQLSSSSKKSCPPSLNDFWPEELCWLKKRRTNAGLEEGVPEKDAVGLACSGGGIRSATFNLGILQALARHGILEKVDYLSTVSGGGYIGTALTWLMGITGEFPFGPTKKEADLDNTKLPERKIPITTALHWLREHSNYLIPGHGLTAWSFAAAIISSVFLSLMVMLPLLFFLAWAIALPLPAGLVDPAVILSGLSPAAATLALLLLPLGLVMILAFGYRILHFCFNFDRLRIGEKERQHWEGMGMLLAASLGIILLGSIPYVEDPLSSSSHWIPCSVTLAGVGLVLGAIRGIGNKKQETIGVFRTAVLLAGLLLVSYSLALLAYHLMRPLHPAAQHKWELLALVGGLVISLLVTLAVNVNHVSLQRYYRNRLREAYLPSPAMMGISNLTMPVPDPDVITFEDVRAKGPNTAPYHIVNVTLQTTGSAETSLRQRGGDNFIFTPHCYGADCTGYRPMGADWMGSFHLATAMAVSGSAVDTNCLGPTRSRPVAALMSLLNLRLGYWIRHPLCRPSCWHSPSWYWYMSREMSGMGLNESQEFLHLSDGGHFENLGVYELIRRRCKTIIAIDASADPDYKFEDLGKLVERVRIDFLARIEIDTRPLRKEDSNPYMEKPFVVGKIAYADGAKGTLIYVKPVLFKGVGSEDVQAYKRSHPEFPQQVTTNQFYDEQQFEAYRELGFLAGQQVCETVEKVMKSVPMIKG